MSLLEIKNLRAGYDGLEVLRGVNMEIEAGEIIAIIGPNGSGKTTVLKSIFNICDVFGGEIIFEGKNIVRRPTHQLIEAGVSFTPQGRQVFSNLTVSENLEMGFFSLKRSDFSEQREMIFRHFPILRQKAKEAAGNLSGGQQQMLSVARALIQNPKLLLMDEPSLGLSPKAMKEVFEKAVELNKDGLSIIIVEQNAKAAAQIAHKTYVLESGRVAMSGGREILDNPEIKKVYFGG